MKKQDQEQFEKIMSFLWTQSGRSGAMPEFDLEVFGNALVKYPIEIISKAASIYAAKGVNYGLKLAEFVEIIEGNPGDQASIQLQKVMDALVNQKYSIYGVQDKEQTIEFSEPFEIKPGVWTEKKEWPVYKVRFFMPVFKDPKTKEIVDQYGFRNLQNKTPYELGFFRNEFINAYMSQNKPASLLEFKDDNSGKIEHDGKQIDLKNTLKGVE